MKINNSSEVRNDRWQAFLMLPLTLLWLAGCDGDGGGSGDDFNWALYSTPVVSSVQISSPRCSLAGPGVPHGAITFGNAGFEAVAPGCSSDAAHMQAWLIVNVEGAPIDHYDWRIVNWTNQPPHGTLEEYSQIVDIDPATGDYIVRTTGNGVLYASAPNGALRSMTGGLFEQVEVTAWSSNGKFTKAYFTLSIGATGGAGSLVNNSLSLGDAPSHARPRALADYYLVKGFGPTEIEMTGFDTYLYLYDSQRRLVAKKDTGAVAGGSRMSVDLAGDTTYYLEATSFDPDVTADYSLIMTRGKFSLTPNPWAQTGSCDDLAGDVGSPGTELEFAL